MMIVLLLCTFIYGIQGQACTSDRVVGEFNTENEKQNNYDTANDNAVLCRDNDYKFSCCGYIRAWEIYVKNGAGSPIDVTLQVWEDTGTLWDLVGENVVTTTNDNAENVITIANGNRIRVKNDDYIGFYQHAGSVITYGGGNNYRRALFAGAQTSYDWDSATSGNNRDHAIHAKVTPSAIPIFTNLDDTVTVPNTQAGGSVLFTLAFSDSDLEDAGQLTLTQTGTTGSASTYFELNTITYDITVQNGITLTPGDHTMSFNVADICGRSSDGTLTLRVTNQPPVITSLPSDTSESEDLSVKKLLHALVVTDTAGSTITCSLSTGGVPFSVELITGSTDYGIYYDASSTMDYQDRNAYALTVSCTDDYDSVTGIFTVNLIQNQPPIINSLPLAVDVSEDTKVETTIYTVSVTDPENVAVDCNLTSITPSVTFFFEKAAPNFNERDFILASSAALDYDSVRTYRLDITCSDERRSDSNVFFVNILRNQPPVFVNLQNITTVSSITSYIGQIVFDVDVTDKENDQVLYSMTCVTSTNCPFEIYHSGEIVLTRSVEGEFVPAYDLYVVVTDGKNTVGPRSLTVHILDINYVPVITNLPLPSPLVVSENAASGLSVFQVSVQDNDNGDTHSYIMTSSPSSGMLYFEVDASSGLIRTTSTNTINYEDISPTTGFNFTVTVTDTKDSASKDLEITIADVNEPPIFTKTSYVLATDEGAAGTVLADPGYLYTDEDPGDTHRFSMVCASNAGYFSITPSNGLITLTTDLDVDGAGLPTSFTCSVTISDGSLTDTASLTINVNNINDNTPAFSSNLYTYYVNINTAVNSVFGSAVATDGDIGSFGTFMYSIDQASLGTETFGIQSNGDVYLKTSLTSYGYGHSLKFRVLATDTGSRQGTATIFVVIPQTTTTTTTTTDRPITFMEYPQNMAWLIVACVLGVVIVFLPCFMLYQTGGTCIWEGRPLGSRGEYHINGRNEESKPKNAQKGRDWNPWKWHQRR